MRVTERGQITIPKKIREKFGFIPDTEVDFEVREGRVELVRGRRRRRAAVDAMYGRKRFDRPTDDLMSLLRE